MKFLISFIIIFLTALYSFGQTDLALRYGIHAGLNISEFNNLPQGLYPYHQDRRIYGGLFLEVPFTKYLAFKPELNYAPEGGDYQYNLSGYDISIQLNYIQLPLQIQLKPYPWLHLTAGPEVAYLISQKTSVSDYLYSNNPMPFPAFTTTNDDFKKFKVGYVFGLEVFPIPSLGIEVKYAQALNNSNNSQTLPAHPTLYNNVISGGIIYKIPIENKK